MWNLVTLDGFFEGGKSWDLGFHQSVWGDELERLSIEHLESADGLLFGHVTYEGIAAYWQTAKGEVAGFMNSLPKAVASAFPANSNHLNLNSSIPGLSPTAASSSNMNPSAARVMERFLLSAILFKPSSSASARGNNVSNLLAAPQPAERVEAK
jgi:hypothetical protein